MSNELTTDWSLTWVIYTEHSLAQNHPSILYHIKTHIPPWECVAGATPRDSLPAHPWVQCDCADALCREGTGVPQPVVTLAWPLHGPEVIGMTWANTRTDTGSLSCSLWALGSLSQGTEVSPAVCSDSPKSTTSFSAGSCVPSAYGVT